MNPIITALSLSLLAGVGASIAQEEIKKPTLNVYTYDSFAAEWGPGGKTEEGFEAICDCDLVFTPAGDGAALLGRLLLEGEKSHADIALGLDQNLAERAANSGLFAPLETEEARAPQEIAHSGLAWDHPNFRAYDWGHLAFVYRKADIAEVPASLEALARSDLRIVIEDPRSSTPGLGFALWGRSAFGEEAAEFWRELSDNIVTITPGWSEAYALFLEGEADAVLSYSTSPAYHKIVEEDEGFAAMRFEEGHWLQIELVGILAASKERELAAKFMDYLLSEEAQAAISGGNWMYPVVDIALPEGFEPAANFPSLEPFPSAAEIEAARSIMLNALGR